MIAAGAVRASTIVWREGMENWKPLGETPEWSGQLVSPVPVAPGAASPYLPPQSVGHPAGYSPYPVAPNNGNAVASMVCGIASVVMMFGCLIGILAAVPAVICGHMALRQIHESAVPMAGRGMAVAGLVTGYITIGLTVLGGGVMLFAILSEM